MCIFFKRKDEGLGDSFSDRIGSLSQVHSLGLVPKSHTEAPQQQGKCHERWSRAVMSLSVCLTLSASTCLKYKEWEKAWPGSDGVAYKLSSTNTPHLHHRKGT